MQTYEEYGHCFNDLFAADHLLTRVAQRLQGPHTELGTNEAFQLLRLALSGFVARLLRQCERRLGEAEALDFGDLGVDLDQQRAAHALLFTRYHQHPERPEPQEPVYWYMARKNGENFTTFQAASNTDAAWKVGFLQAGCSDPTAQFSFVALDDVL